MLPTREATTGREAGWPVARAQAGGPGAASGAGTAAPASRADLREHSQGVGLGPDAGLAAGI